MTRAAISARLSAASRTPPIFRLIRTKSAARRASRVSRSWFRAITILTPDFGLCEFDFLGAGVTANSTESNSYQPRVRHLYATIDWAGEGLHLLAGQTWSLITMNQKGITPRNEDIPLTIDAQYVAGFAWLRTPQLRLVKNFGDNFWLAASAELPQTGTPCTGGNTGVNTAIPPTAVGATMATCSQVTSGGSGLLNSTNKYSLNPHSGLRS